VKTCPDCNGDGVIQKGTDDEQQCPTCGGSGFVPDDDDDEEVVRTARDRPLDRPLPSIGIGGTLSQSNNAFTSGPAT
jgi:RecJ-like exonuclease